VVAEILVAGSGAAGLTAALTAATAGVRVTLAESAAELGGTTALSFGRVWVPAAGDPHAQDYLTAVYGDRYPRMIEAFLAAAPRMTEFAQSHSALRFAPCESYPDYHPGLTGASRGGRALDPPDRGTPGLVRRGERSRSYRPGWPGHDGQRERGDHGHRRLRP
jgi:3-oxosteroid 1-dehydrogenase